MPLHHYRSVGSRILDHDGLAGDDGEFFGAKRMGFVTDPLFVKAFRVHLFGRPGTQNERGTQLGARRRIP
jgi:hypothetical protein